MKTGFGRRSFPCSVVWGLPGVVGCADELPTLEMPPAESRGPKMDGKKLSVRAARMELGFALVEGDRHRIEIAERQLKEALAEAERKRASENDGKK
jgi:hypothetical protein